MPVNPLLDTDSKEDNDKKSPDDVPGTQITSGESAEVTGLSSQGSAGVTPANQTSSGSFTNLNQYVEANKDQAQGLGGKIEQNVQQTASKGLGGLSSSQQEYKQAQQAASVNPEDYSSEKVNQTVEKAFLNPSQVAQSDIEKFNEARAKAQAFQSGTDAAPKTLQELNSYQKSLQDLQSAQEKANLTGSESGRETLLRDTYKRPDYTKGQSAFDQLLTQNVPENRSRFENLRNNLLGQYGIEGQNAQAIQQASDFRNQQIQNASNAAQNIQNSLFGSKAEITPELKVHINNIIASMLGGQQPRDVDLQALKQAQGVLGGYEQVLQALPEYENQLGQQSVAQTQNKLAEYLKGIPFASPSAIDLANQYVTPGSTPGTATLSNVISPDYLARVNALNQLAGRQAGTIGSNIVEKAADQVFNPRANINSAALQKAVDQKVAAYKSDLASKTAQIQGNMGHINDILNKPWLHSGASIANDTNALNLNTRQLDDINNLRKSYGLQPVQINPAQVEYYENLLWTNLGKVYGMQNVTGPNSFYKRQPERVRDYQMVAKAAATADLIAKLRANPDLDLPDTRLNINPALLSNYNVIGNPQGVNNQAPEPTPEGGTAIDTSGWPVDASGTRIPPWLVLPGPQESAPAPQAQPEPQPTSPGNTTTRTFF